MQRTRLDVYLAGSWGNRGAAPLAIDRDPREPAFRQFSADYFRTAGTSRTSGLAKTVAPTSLCNRWNSGDSIMISPAAARKRSTDTLGRRSAVGCWLRYLASSLF